MNNTLTDLNNFLFGQLERLDDPELDTESLEKEIKRTEAMKDVGSVIIDNAKLQLRAWELNDARFDMEKPAPRHLLGNANE